jgi:hypothetical protein
MVAPCPLKYRDFTVESVVSEIAGFHQLP